MFRQVEESQTLLINNQSKKLISQNQKIIKFGFGQSPFLPPKEVMNELKNAVNHKEYSSVQGDENLRKLMANFHEEHNGLKVKYDNILTAPGSKILIFNTLLAFEKADVYIPAPAWVSYAPQAKLVGHNVIKLKTDFEDRWRVNAKILKDAFKKKKHKPTVLILNYPGNPDGLTYSETELLEIASEAKKQDILVISDEIYGLLDYSLKHKSLSTYYPEKTITTTGLSKWCGAGGWRFGAAFLYDNIESDFKQALIGIGSETYSCAPVPVQIAAKEAYKSYNDTLPYLQWQTNILKQIGEYCVEELRKANVKVHTPQGGFYIFPDFSNYKEKLAAKGIVTSNELCQKLLNETGVAILPATAFGFEEDYLAARLAFVDFEVLDELKEFTLEKDAANVILGIKAICKWLTKL